MSTVLLITDDSDLERSVAESVGMVRGSKIEVVRTQSFDSTDLQEKSLVILHLVNGELSLANDLRRLRADQPGPLPLVFILERFDTETAVKLWEIGAADVTARPLDINRLALMMDMLTLRERFFGKSTEAVDCNPPPDSSLVSVETAASECGTFVYTSRSMSRIMDQVRTVADRRSTILLTGETGTGKTTLARLIHEISSRRQRPFVTVNCGALSSMLVESEMFGHVKGAFTSAYADREGKFITAGNGTLLLDEIDTLPLTTQAKLLRVVDEHVFEPVGSDRTFRFEGRLIVATNQPLKEKIAEKRFRSDLFFRLNVISFHLPPLRQRRALLRPLCDKLLSSIAAPYGSSAPKLSNQAFQALECYTWPGNIRELRNAIERSVSLCRDELIELIDLPQEIQDSFHQGRDPTKHAGRTQWRSAKAEAEEMAVRQALEKCRNNRTHAARELGISRNTLYKKMHAFGLT